MALRNLVCIRGRCEVVLDRGRVNLCECGCGTPVGLSARRPRRQLRWVRGHHRRKPVIERLLDKAEVTVPSDRCPERGPCWEWTAYRNAGGYGVIGVEGRATKLAHRVSYEHHVGPIPEGTELDHLCRVRHCINPEHLEAVTRQTNVLRGEAPPAQQARQTTCQNGHPFDITRPDGRRACSICRRVTQARYRAKAA